jgi:threonylcarbamoyladenosine tRNA methylthiotransferase MtaB
VFTYSARPGTPAAAMANQVPVQVARERNRVLRDLAATKKEAFQQSFVGSTLPAITLSSVHNFPEGEFTEALTDNYQKLFLRGRHEANRWIAAQIDGVRNGALLGDTGVRFAYAPGRLSRRSFTSPENRLRSG